MPTIPHTTTPCVSPDRDRRIDLSTERWISQSTPNLSPTSQNTWREAGLSKSHKSHGSHPDEMWVDDAVKLNISYAPPRRKHSHNEEEIVENNKTSQNKRRRDSMLIGKDKLAALRTRKNSISTLNVQGKDIPRKSRSQDLTNMKHKPSEKQTDNYIEAERTLAKRPKKQSCMDMLTLTKVARRRLSEPAMSLSLTKHMTDTGSGEHIKPPRHQEHIKPPRHQEHIKPPRHQEHIKPPRHHKLPPLPSHNKTILPPIIQDFTHH